MTRRSEFHEFARDEYIAAARWYEERQPGLGGEFVEAIESLVERAADDRLPGLAGGTPSQGVLKLLDPRFGYAIYIEPSKEVMYVWAVAHGADALGTGGEGFTSLAVSQDRRTACGSAAPKASAEAAGSAGQG